MTAALPAATVDALARARHQVAEHAADMEMWLTTHDRDQVVAANAVQLVADHGSDPEALAYLAAEAIAQLVPPVREQHVDWPPAGPYIRLASDFADNQPLGGRGA